MERGKLEEENEKLKSLAYRTNKDVKEELEYEVSRATVEKDSLLVLMELRENKQLKYVELEDKVTQSNNLFLRLADLTNVNFIGVSGHTGSFSITPKGIDFLEKRGL